MDADRNPVKPAVILKVEGGRFRFAAAIAPDEERAVSGAGSETIRSSSNEASPGPAVATPARPAAGLRILGVEELLVVDGDRHASARPAVAPIFSQPRSNVAGPRPSSDALPSTVARTGRARRTACRRAAAGSSSRPRGGEPAPPGPAPFLTKVETDAVLERRVAPQGRGDRTRGPLRVRPGRDGWAPRADSDRPGSATWPLRASPRTTRSKNAGRAHDRVGVEVVAKLLRASGREPSPSARTEQKAGTRRSEPAVRFHRREKTLRMP